MLALVVSGFIVQTWSIVGQFSMGVVREKFVKVTRFVVMRCAFSWALWVAVLVVYVWEKRCVKRHYTATEWGASLQTLDSFDSAEGGNWSKAGQDLLLRGDALAYRDPGVTPYYEEYVRGSDSKGYDAPPPSESCASSPFESLATASTGPRTAKPDPAHLLPWKAALSRGDFVLGPDMTSQMHKAKHAAPEKPEQAWDISGRPEPFKKAEPNTETANRNNPPARKWVPEDRYWCEKVRIIEDSFGPALCRTQSM